MLLRQRHRLHLGFRLGMQHALRQQHSGVLQRQQWLERLPTARFHYSGFSSTLSCPASNGMNVTSNGSGFVVQCGIDHAGGDVASITVESFQACIDACATYAGGMCVDISLSGSSCYLKQALGPAVEAPSIWDARLVTQAAAPTSSSSASSSSSSTSFETGAPSNSAQTTSTTASTPNASPSAVSLACPDSDGQSYSTSRGNTYLIECSIDHEGGDLTSKAVSVGSLADCVAPCDETPGCVDVALSGAACYMKQSIRAAVKNGVWGAKLVSSASVSGVKHIREPDHYINSYGDLVVY